MIRSLGLAVAAFFVGVSFLIVSHFIGVLQFQSCWVDKVLVACADGDVLRKEVGFFAALNWSLGLVVLFPLFIFFAGQTYNHAQQAVAEMTAHGMIVTDQWQPVAEADVMRILRRQSTFMIACLIAILVLGAVFLADDFVDVVLAPYWDPTTLATLRLDDPVREVDWSVAGAVCVSLDGDACRMSAFDRSANMYFAGIAYIYLTWIGAGLALGFMLAVLSFATSFLSADFRAQRMMLIPDVTSKDPRRGFEILEHFFSSAIAACFMLFAMGYLVTLQNVYLRTDKTSILQLVFPFFQPGAELSADGVIDSIKTTIADQMGVINPNIIAVTVIGLLFLLIMLVSVAVILRLTAQRGMKVLDRALNTTAKGSKTQIAAYLAGRGTSVKSAKDAMAQFAFWPVRWLKVNTLFAWLAAATLSLLVVTIGAYIISAGLWAILRSLYARIERGMGFGG